MIPELQGILDSLTSLLREETTLLAQAADGGELAEVAAAKIRVAAALEAQFAMQARSGACRRGCGAGRRPFGSIRRARSSLPLLC